MIAGVIVPIVLHVLNSKLMPWWPDTVSMGIAFGAAAVIIVHKARTDREMNRRLWKALKALVGQRDSNLFHQPAVARPRKLLLPRTARGAGNRVSATRPSVFRFRVARPFQGRGGRGAASPALHRNENRHRLSQRTRDLSNNGHQKVRLLRGRLVAAAAASRSSKR